MSRAGQRAVQRQVDPGNAGFRNNAPQRAILPADWSRKTTQERTRRNAPVAGNARETSDAARNRPVRGRYDHSADSFHKILESALLLFAIAPV